MPKAQKIRETHINIYIYDGCQRENQKNEYKSTKGSKGTQILTHWHPAAFEDSHANTTRLHMALCARNSGTKSSRE